MSEEQLTVESLAKVMADFIGHGMTEKCERHAQAVMPLLATIERDTAEKCAEMARTHVLGTDEDGEDAFAYDVCEAILSHFNIGEKP